MHYELLALCPVNGQCVSIWVGKRCFKEPRVESSRTYVVTSNSS